MREFVKALRHALEWASGDDVEKAIGLVADARDRKNRVFFIGNGGSAAIASHMAIDFQNKAHIAALAFNDGAALTCLANDYGYDEVFARPLLCHARDGDVLFAISSSGESESVTGPAILLRDRVQVVTLTGFKPDNSLRNLGHVNFHVPSESYGVVETAHLAILHAILERLQ